MSTVDICLHLFKQQEEVADVCWIAFYSSLIRIDDKDW